MANMKENPLEKFSIKALIEKVIYSLIGLDERYRLAGMEKKTADRVFTIPRKTGFRWRFISNTPIELNCRIYLID